MQRVGQQTMYDMRTAIFRHIQRLPMSYFDRNPVGRLITRVTTDVDALNDLFAAGVVTMINDFFLLAVLAAWLFSIDHRLAFDALAVLPFILVVTFFFRKYRSRRQPSHSHRCRQHQLLPAGIHLRHERRAALQSRAKSARRIRPPQQRQHARLARRHSRLRALLSRGRNSQHLRHRAHLLVRRQSRAQRHSQPRRPHRVHDVRHALLPPHPGPQRKVQHPAVRDGRFRAHFQTAR